MTRDDTKAKILDIIEKLVEEKPLSKIIINEITDASGVSRQTFYYYFKNIYDVYLWAVKSSMTYFDGRMSGRFAASPSECIVDLCKALQKNRKLTYEFIDCGYGTQMKNDLREYLLKVCRNNLGYILEGVDSGNQIDTLARFHTEGYIGLIRDWVDNDMSYDMAAEMEKLRLAFRMVMDQDIVRRAESNVFPR